MQPLKAREAGLIFWAIGDPASAVHDAASIGVRCGQLGIPGALPLTGATARAWEQALKSQGFTIVTLFAAYEGESYADIPTVQRTVGFIPPATRVEREKRTYEVSDFAAALGVPGIACHIGFVPDDRHSPDYKEVREVVRRVCDYVARHNQTFALETGQEPAQVLLEFIRDVDRPNLRVNFDPANMILYGTGDPIAALEALGPLVVSVHAKDADWPPRDKPGALGEEQPLGRGAVGIERLVALLKQIAYTGPLIIEREIEDREQKAADLRMAVELLERTERG
jgi:sugar phosphate isomerase/epimerase